MPDNKPIRQGELLLLPVERVPDDTPSRAQSYTLAHSETGHHHVLESDVDFEIWSDDDLYLRLLEPAKLVHNKSVDAHRTLTVAPGTYKLVRKVEYDPFQKMVRAIRD